MWTLRGWERGDLICEDCNQGAQRVEVWIDTRGGEIAVDTYQSCERGVPGDVWHGIIRTYAITEDDNGVNRGGVVDAAKLDALLASAECTALVERLVAGSDEVWDGNNHVVQMDADAEAADAEIGELLRRSADTDLSCADAGDWCAMCSATELGVTATSSDEEIDQIASRLESESLSDQDVVVWGMIEYLRKKRDELADDEATED